MEKYRYMVFTRCLTYNHASYIIEAMNGFCMQKTSFPFLTAIIDDASTDGEQVVIEMYLQEHFDLNDMTIAHREDTKDYRLIFAQHLTNKNCFFAVLFLKYNHNTIKKNKQPYYAEWESSSKYIALCEGDDYWTDSLKLQKQVDFLDSNHEYVFCCHRYNCFDMDTSNLSNDCASKLFTPDKNLIVTHEVQSKAWITKTLSLVIRSNEYRTAIARSIEYYHSTRDAYWIYELLELGNGLALNQNMGIYRQHAGGIWSKVSYKERIRTSYYVYKNILEHHHGSYLMYNIVQRLAISNACCLRWWNQKDIGIFKESKQYYTSCLIKIKAYIALIIPFPIWLCIKKCHFFFSTRL